MFKFIRHFIAAFRKPNILTMKAAELLEAQEKLMQAQTAVEYAQSIVDYNNARIKRLTTDIQNTPTAAPN